MFWKYLWRALRVKLVVFVGICILAGTWFGGGRTTLPTERKPDPTIQCNHMPTFDTDPNRCYK